MRFPTFFFLNKRTSQVTLKSWCEGGLKCTCLVYLDFLFRFHLQYFSSSFIIFQAVFQVKKKESDSHDSWFFQENEDAVTCMSPVSSSLQKTSISCFLMMHPLSCFSSFTIHVSRVVIVVFDVGLVLVVGIISFLFFSWRDRGSRF